jgi:hypothetical protein
LSRKSRRIMVSSSFCSLVMLDLLRRAVDGGSYEAYCGLSCGMNGLAAKADGT